MAILVPTVEEVGQLAARVADLEMWRKSLEPGPAPAPEPTPEPAPQPEPTPALQLITSPGTYDFTGVTIAKPIDGKAAVLVQASGPVVIRNFISPELPREGNIAAVKCEGVNFHVTLQNCDFNKSDMGVLTDNRGGTLIVEDTEVADMGLNPNAALGHGIYAGEIDEFIVRRSKVLRSRNYGHLIKSRAKKNTIEESIVAQLDDRTPPVGDNEVGPGSRIIDFSTGGQNVVRRNVFQQGPEVDNPEMIAFALEGVRGDVQESLVEDNIFISDARRRPFSSVISPYSARLNPHKVISKRNKFISANGTDLKMVVGQYIPAGNLVQEGDQEFIGREAAGIAPYPALPPLPASAPTPVPALAPSTEGTITNISKNTIAEVQPCPAGTCIYSGTERIQGMFAWGGAAWVIVNGKMRLVKWGGGHRSYGGNEVYVYHHETGLWVCMGVPSLFSDAAGSPDELSLTEWGDHGPGHPSPPHNYRGIFGLNPEEGGGAEGSLVQVSMNAVSGAALSLRGSHIFSLETKVWDRYARTLSPYRIGYTPVCKDSGRKRFYAGTDAQSAFGDRIQILDQQTREWDVQICPTPPTQFGAHQVMEYIPAPFDCLAFIRTSLGGASSSNPQVWTVPVNNFQEGWSQRETTAFEGDLISGHSMNWANFLGELALYSGRGENHIDFLKPVLNGMWEWRKQTFAGEPANTGGGGYAPPYNRMMPDESSKSFLWLAGSATPVQRWTP
jgi:hypothetical protein